MGDEEETKWRLLCPMCATRLLKVERDITARVMTSPLQL